MKRNCVHDVGSKLTLIKLYNETASMKKICFHLKSNLSLITAEIFVIIYQGRVMFSFQIVCVAHAWLLGIEYIRIPDRNCQSIGRLIVSHMLH